MGNNAKVNIYRSDGLILGYFVDPKIDAFAQGEYELSGQFFEPNGQPTLKIDFNPEALPYIADLSPVKDARHKRLKNVYVQRGRQPIRMSGVGDVSAG